MAETRSCESCRLSWTRANTETYSREPELAAQRAARERTPEAMKAMTDAIRRAADDMTEYMLVWNIGTCPNCRGSLRTDGNAMGKHRAPTH